MPSGGAPTGDHEPAWLKEGGKQPLLPPEAKEAEDASSVDEEAAGGSSSSSVKGSKRGRSSVGKGRRRGTRRMTRPFFAVLGTVTALAALAVVAANLYVLVADGQKETEEEGVDRAFLRGFGVLLALVALVTELRLKWWKRLCPVLVNFLFVRGLLYTLVALLTLSDFSHWTEANNVVGCIFLCCAGLYLCAGLLCMRRHVDVEGNGS